MTGSSRTGSQLSGGAGAGRSTRQDMLERLKELNSGGTTDPAAIKDKSRIIVELQELCRFLQVENQQLQAQVVEGQETQDRLEAEARAQQHRMQETREQLKEMEQQLLPLDMEIEQVEGRIQDIEADIKRFDTQGTVDVGKKTIVSETKEGKLRQATQLQFRRMEELVFVLKKRVSALEENASLAEVIQEHGSLPELLKENTILKKENGVLRLREQRFATVPLLRRRRLMDAEPAFLRLMIIALQNELTAAREVIEKHSYSRNPSLKLLVHPPAPIPDEMDLKDIDTIFRKNEWAEFGSQFAAEEGKAEGELATGLDATSDDTEAMRQRLSLLEHVNMKLQSQVERLEVERRKKKEIDKTREDVIVEFVTGKKGGELNSKERRIAELQQKNEELIDDEVKLIDVIAQKDKAIEMQEDMQNELSEEKKELTSENLVLSEKMLKLRQNNEALRLACQRKETQFKSMHKLATSLIHSVLEGLNLPRGRRAAVIKYSFRDLLAVHLKTTMAAVKIQSLFRARKTRKALGVQGKPWGYLAAMEQMRAAEAATKPEDFVMNGLPKDDGGVANPKATYTTSFVRAGEGDARRITIPSKKGDAKAPLRFEQQKWIRTLVVRTGAKVIDHGTYWTDDPSFHLPSPRPTSVAFTENNGSNAASTETTPNSKAGGAASAAAGGAADSPASSRAGTGLGDSSASSTGAAEEPAPTALDMLWAELHKEGNSLAAPRPPPKDVVPRVSAFRAIVEVLLQMESETDHLRKIPLLLRVIKKELHNEFVPEMKRLVEGTKRYMDDKVKVIEENMKRVLLKPTISRVTMTRVITADTTTMTEEEEEDPKAKKGNPKDAKKKK